MPKLVWRIETKEGVGYYCAQNQPYLSHSLGAVAVIPQADSEPLKTFAQSEFHRHGHTSYARNNKSPYVCGFHSVEQLGRWFNLSLFCCVRYLIKDMYGDIRTTELFLVAYAAKEVIEGTSQVMFDKPSSVRLASFRIGSRFTQKRVKEFERDYTERTSQQAA